MTDKTWINIGKITITFLWWTPLLIAVGMATDYFWIYWPAMISLAIGLVNLISTLWKKDA